MHFDVVRIIYDIVTSNEKKKVGIKLLRWLVHLLMHDVLISYWAEY